MSFQDERAAIESRFATAWAGQTAVKYENQHFTAPRNAHWVALHVLQGDGVQDSLNAPYHFTHDGLVIVQIFAPEGAGIQTALGYANDVDEIFRRQRVTSGSNALIVFGADGRAPAVRKVGLRDGLYQINVVCPYQRQISHEE